MKVIRRYIAIVLCVTTLFQFMPQSIVVADENSAVVEKTTEKQVGNHVKADRTANTRILATPTNSVRQTAVKIECEGEMADKIRKIRCKLGQDDINSEDNVFTLTNDGSKDLTIEVVPEDGEDIMIESTDNEKSTVDSSNPACVTIPKEELEGKDKLDIKLKIEYKYKLTYSYDTNGKFNIESGYTPSGVTIKSLNEDGSGLNIQCSNNYYAKFEETENLRIKKNSNGAKLTLKDGAEAGTITFRMYKDNTVPEIETIKDNFDENKKAVCSDENADIPVYKYYSQDGNCDLNIICRDVESGIYSIEYSYFKDGQDYTALQVKNSSAILEVRRDINVFDNINYTLKITDYSGHEKIVKLTVIIDSEPPKIVEDSVKEVDENGIEDTSIIKSEVSDEGSYWETDRDHYLSCGITEENLNTDISYKIYKDSEQIQDDDTGIECKLEMLSDKLDSDHTATYMMKVDKSQLENLPEGTYHIVPTIVDEANNRCVPTDFYTFTIKDASPKVVPVIDEKVVWKRTKAENINDIKEIEAELSTTWNIKDLAYMITINDDTQPSAEDEGWTKVAEDKVTCGNGARATVKYKVPVGQAVEGTNKYYFWVKTARNKISRAEDILVYNIDNTAPVVSNLHVEDVNGTAIDRVFNFVFGSFIQETQKLRFTVEARDSLTGAYDKQYAESYSSDSIKSVKLYYLSSSAVESTDSQDVEELYAQLENENLKTQKFAPNGGGSYTCELELPENNKFYKIYIVAEDKTGNVSVSTIKALSDKSSLVLADSKKPTIDVTTTDNSRTPDYTDGDKLWYSSASGISYKFAVTDMESGIYEVNASVNGETLSKDKNGNNLYKTNRYDLAIRETDKTYTIGVDNTRLSADGSIEIGFGAEDNAGNTSKDKRKIYIDKDNPVISGVHFDTHTDSVAIVPKQYGYFFTKKTDVTVNATDFIGKTSKEGSGVKSVTYSLIPADGSNTVTNTLEVSQVSGKKATYNAKFTIPEGFKGQVQIYVTDNVGRNCKVYNPKGVVIESRQQHEKTSATDIRLPETEYKDSEGNPLYNKNINVKAIVKDPKSGIASINLLMGEYYVDKPLVADELTIKSQYDERKEKWSSEISGADGWNLPDEAELNIVTSANKTIAVKSETNHISTDIDFTDNAGNASSKENVVFSIDKSAPEIEVEYDNNDAENDKYYKENRTATIRIKDANFSEKDTKIELTGPKAAIGKWHHKAGAGCDGKVHTSECTYTCEVEFVEDGDYSMTVSSTDLAGNHASYGKTDEFTIDKTAPVVKVTYNNNAKSSGNYYQNARTATIEITDKSFDDTRTKVNVTAGPDKSTGNAPKASAFVQNGDVWTATVGFNEDNQYSISVESTDKAGNEGNKYDTEEFIVDMTMPEVSIEGVVDKSANNDKVEPVITVSDKNLDVQTFEVSLVGKNNGDIKYKSSRSQTDDTISVKIKDLAHDKKMDDLYTLSVKVSDKAGNVKEEKRTYSINRFGSVYVLSDSTQKLVDDYYINQEQDVVLTEINVDLLKKSSIECSMDGMTSTLEEDKDYVVNKNTKEGSWKTYEYRIKKEKFATEAKYVISMYSEDKATNKSTNRSKGMDVGFVVDKTAPTIVLTGVESGKHYVAVDKNVYIDVQDNILVDNMVMYNNDKQVLCRNSDEILDSLGKVETKVESSDKWQAIYVEARDAAGNMATSVRIDFLLTTNLLVQMKANAMALGGLCTIAIIGAYAVGVNIKKGTQKKKSKATNFS